MALVAMVVNSFVKYSHAQFVCEAPQLLVMLHSQRHVDGKLWQW